MWTFDNSAANEPRYGAPCSTDSDCRPSVAGNVMGACVPAYRAYCPAPCEAHEFVVGSASSSPLSAAAVQLIAADELAQVTALCNRTAFVTVSALQTAGYTRHDATRHCAGHGAVPERGRGPEAVEAALRDRWRPAGAGLLRRCG